MKVDRSELLGAKQPRQEAKLKPADGQVLQYRHGNNSASNIKTEA